VTNLEPDSVSYIFLYGAYQTKLCINLKTELRAVSKSLNFYDFIFHTGPYVRLGVGGSSVGIVTRLRV
jgi:hypothetical protein